MKHKKGDVLFYMEVFKFIDEPDIYVKCGKIVNINNPYATFNNSVEPVHQKYIYSSIRHMVEDVKRIKDEEIKKEATRKLKRFVKKICKFNN